MIFMSDTSCVYGKFRPTAMQWELKFDSINSTVGSTRYLEIDSSYTARLGEFPTVIIWDDTKDPIRVAWTFTALTWATPEAKAAWDSAVTWQDVRPFFSIELKSVKTDSLRTIQVDEIDGSAKIEKDSFFHSILGDFTVNARSLPIPKDGSAWSIQLVVSDTTGSVKRLSASQPIASIARMNRDTAIDSLQWAYRNGHSKEPQVVLALLQQFPEDTSLLWTIFDYYRARRDVDQIRYWGKRLNANVVGNKFSFTEDPDLPKMSPPDYAEIVYEDSTGTEHTVHNTLDYIHWSLYKACGDTTLYDK